MNRTRTATAAALLIRNGENGATVPECDEAAFIAAAVGLAQAPELRATLGEAARRSVLPLAWEAVVADFEASLRETISRRARKAD